jgi:magnesium-transporting ATPase (P-type)
MLLSLIEIVNSKSVDVKMITGDSRETAQKRFCYAFKILKSTLSGE